jgi:hypothetical protein
MEYEIERCEPWPMFSIVLGAGIPEEHQWWCGMRRFIECVQFGWVIDA